MFCIHFSDPTMFGYLDGLYLSWVVNNAANVGSELTNNLANAAAVLVKHCNKQLDIFRLFFGNPSFTIQRPLLCEIGQVEGKLKYGETYKKIFGASN